MELWYGSLACRMSIEWWIIQIVSIATRLMIALFLSSFQVCRVHRFEYVCLGLGLNLSYYVVFCCFRWSDGQKHTCLHINGLWSVHGQCRGSLYDFINNMKTILFSLNTQYQWDVWLKLSYHRFISISGIKQQRYRPIHSSRWIFYAWTYIIDMNDV